MTYRYEDITILRASSILSVLVLGTVLGKNKTKKLARTMGGRIWCDDNHTYTLF